MMRKHSRFDRATFGGLFVGAPKEPLVVHEAEEIQAKLNEVRAAAAPDEVAGLDAAIRHVNGFVERSDEMRTAAWLQRLLGELPEGSDHVELTRRVRQALPALSLREAAMLAKVVRTAS